MKIFSEFIIYHEDQPMPDATNFCPELWKNSDFDSEGDFYYEGINGRWTNLVLESKEFEKNNSILNIDIYRENDRFYNPSTTAAKLQKYVEYAEDGEYKSYEQISSIKNPAVALFTFETYHLNHYKIFLETIYYFLNHSKGLLLNYYNCNAEKFHKEFLD